MKSHTLLIILVIIACFALFSFSQIFSKSSEADAKKFFEEDLAESYPYADLREIISVQKHDSSSGEYYILKASVSSGLSTACPERLEVEYHYPSRNFLKRDDKVVYGCKVCMDASQCHISYMEEAIIASHTYEGTEKVKSYIMKYSNAKPQVEFLSNYNSEKNVWYVKWDCEDSSYLMDVYLPQNGAKAISVQTTNKQ